MAAKPNRKPRRKITYTAKAALPEGGYIRLPTAIAFFGVSKNTYLNGEIFPKGFLLTPRTRVIPVEDIRAADEKIRQQRERGAYKTPNTNRTSAGVFFSDAYKHEHYIAARKAMRNQTKPTAHEIIGNFRMAMAEHGIITDAPIIPDGKLHRIHVKGHKNGSLNGAYTLHLDGVPAGYFENFTTGQRYKWKLPGSEHHPPDPGELARIEAAKNTREKERLMSEQATANKAAYILRATNLAENNPYCLAKGIQPHGAHQGREGAFITPVYNANNSLISLQFIRPDGSKSFLKGGRKIGGFWWIGQKTDTVLIAEDFATAASLYEATGLLTVIAYDAGNLEPVAKIIRQRHPTAEIIVCADNDESGIGEIKANKAALAVNGLVAMPPITGDFNDWACSLKGAQHG